MFGDTIRLPVLKQDFKESAGAQEASKPV